MDWNSNRNVWWNLRVVDQKTIDFQLISHCDTTVRKCIMRDDEVREEDDQEDAREGTDAQEDAKEET